MVTIHISYQFQRFRLVIKILVHHYSCLNPTFYDFSHGTETAAGCWTWWSAARRPWPRGGPRAGRWTPWCAWPRWSWNEASTRRRWGTTRPGDFWGRRHRDTLWVGGNTLWVGGKKPPGEILMISMGDFDVQPMGITLDGHWPTWEGQSRWTRHLRKMWFDTWRASSGCHGWGMELGWVDGKMMGISWGYSRTVGRCSICRVSLGCRGGTALSKLRNLSFKAYFSCSGALEHPPLMLAIYTYICIYMIIYVYIYIYNNVI